LRPSPGSLGLSTPSGGSLLPMPYQPLAPASAELVPSALPAALMQQFAMLHQQMLAQFQQSMLVMAQMFTTLRQEEMELLREVLERLGSLKQKVRGLAAAEKKRAAPRRGQNDETAEPAPILDRVESPDRAARPSQDAAQRAMANTPTDSAPALDPPLPTEENGSNSQSSVTPSFAGTNVDPSLHAWLSGRVAMLDQERQGVWRRLMAVLFGS